MPAVTFGVAPTPFTAGFDATRGWEFTVLQAIDVVAIGLWDEGGDGFAEAHDVGLWTGAGALVGSANMAAGLSGVLGADGFRYLAFGPTALLPGTYRVGASYLEDSPDRIAREGDPVGAAGFVTYVGSRLSPGGGFADPSDVSANEEGNFGPNFRFTPQAVVPEPTTWALLAGGLVMLGGVARRRTTAGR